MAATRKMTVSVPQALFERAERLAQRLRVSRSRVFALALEQFFLHNPEPEAPDAAAAGDPAGPDRPARRTVRQGEVYWLAVEAPGGKQAGVLHPHVVIQEDVINHSRVETVVVCALTSNLKRAKSPGNVLLEVGEANLPRQSVVEVSKVSAVARGQLGEYIGALSRERVGQILAGMQFLQSLAYRPNG